MGMGLGKHGKRPLNGSRKSQIVKRGWEAMAGNMEERLDLAAFDAEYREQYPLLCGVDEAGRGPLAGGVCAAAVILDPEKPIPGLNDSKKLSPKKREALYGLIVERAAAWAVAWADEREIDEYNILNATFLAMRRAVEKLGLPPGCVLVDGNRDPGFPGGVPTVTLVKGDGRSATVAAASILAKVTRDRAMLALEEQYPQYGFAKHKGYGTKLHYERLAQYGVSPVHRKSFLKNLAEHTGKGGDAL